MKKTQCDRIVSYLRRHKKATTYELIVNCGSLCPWKRLAENDIKVSREFVKTKGGARVVQYRLA